MAVNAAEYRADIDMVLEVRVDMHPIFLASSDKSARAQAEAQAQEFVRAVEELAKRFSHCTVQVKQLPDANEK